MAVEILRQVVSAELARAFGLNPFDHKEEDPLKLTPSIERAERFWRQVEREADQIETLFIRIYRKLELLNQWAELGHVKREDVAQGKEWFELRNKALPVLMSRLGYLDDLTWEDGAGI